MRNFCNVVFMLIFLSTVHLAACNTVENTSLEESSTACGKVSVYLYGGEIKVGTFYDEGLGKCAIYLNALCSNNVNHSADPATIPICPTNAFCDDRKSECTCEKGFFPNAEENACNAAVQYGETCDVEGGPCSQLPGLSCMNRTCVCDPQQYVYDAQSGGCKSLVGTECKYYWEHNCVENAGCDTRSRQCTCLKGFISTPDKLCKPGYLYECSATGLKNCGANLVCADGFCKCKTSTFQKYDPNQQKCVYLLGSKCENLDETDSCPTNAHCSPNEPNEEPICKCDNGYFENAHGECRENGLDLNETCKNYQCNPSKGLACINGKCDCINSDLIYHSHEIGGCSTSVGERCGWIEPILIKKGDNNCKPGQPDCDYYLVSCEPGSECVTSSFHGEGICRKKD